MSQPYTQEEWAIFDKIDKLCLREDIKYVAEDMDIELDDEDIETVIEVYEDMESMDTAKRTTIEHAILRIK